MKGLIDATGQLWIFRPGLNYKKGRPLVMQCRFASVPYTVCSDDCPHFGEPQFVGSGSILYHEASWAGIYYVLELCHGKKLRFTEFEDLRTAEQKEPPDLEGPIQPDE